MSLNKRLMSSQPAAPFVASENFKVVTWDGNATDNREIEVGFKPDMVWYKTRNQTNDHNLSDSTRGAAKQLRPNRLIAEVSATDQIKSFTATGFTVGTGGDANANNNTYVAWCWKASGGTTSSNTNGSITSTVQANQDAGFSIVTYTGTNGVDTVGHGLSQQPELMFIKNRGRAVTGAVYSTAINSTGYLFAGSSGNEAFNASRNDWMNNNTAPTSSVFTVRSYDGAGNDTQDYIGNYASDTYVVYLFHSVDGFSKIGSYTGNGNADGPIQETGFEPAFIMVKRTNATSNWVIYDNKRNTANPRFTYSLANENSAESGTAGNAAPQLDFLSNGFKPSGTEGYVNANGDNYIYMAFAADPDTEAPTLADSFDIKTYSMSGGSDYDLSFNFRPQFVVTKTRDEGAHWSWNDVVRGANSSLASNDSNAVSSSHQWRVKDWFTGSTSVTIAQHASTDTANISYAWKADDNEPTIFGGPAIAVYKFEDNANDVTGNYNGTASNVSYVTGNFNKAAEFNGSNSGVNIGNLGIGGAAARTISAWVYVDNLDSAQTIFQYGSNSNGQRFGWAIDTAGKIYVEFYNRDAITSSAHISANTWYHLVATYNGGAIQTAANTQIYVDGVAVAMSNSGAQTGNANTGDSNYGIGYDRLNTRQYFDGKIDQLRIYRGALKEYQVNELYNETASQNDDLSLGGLPEILISANANAGFSIVKYTGNGLSGAKVPHGLSAAPDMVIAKGISGGGSSWWVQHKSLAANKVLELNTGSAQATYSSVFNNTAATSTVVTLGSGDTNRNGETQILYCFHDVAGYQKFGSYAGNGSSQSINVGFQPDFVMLRKYDSSQDWMIFDSVRDGNPKTKRLEANNSDAEATGTTNINFTSTGFEFTSASYNDDGYNSIYWAIKIN